MPHAIFFDEGYAIHGTVYVSRLGNRASHGCVRLHPSNAATLFSLVRSRGMGSTTIVVSNAGWPIAKKKPDPEAAVKVSVPVASLPKLATPGDGCAAVACLGEIRKGPDGADCRHPARIDRHGVHSAGRTGITCGRSRGRRRAILTR